LNGLCGLIGMDFYPIRTPAAKVRNGTLSMRSEAIVLEDWPVY
jgi:hypothetical protein